MLTYYYIYYIVEHMSMEAITLKAYRKGFLKGHTNESEKGYEKDDNKKAQKLDKEIAKDKASGNDDELYEEDDRVKRDKERDDALRDKEKAKDDACVVRADEDTIDDDEEYGDDDKLRDEILGVMEELCDTLNDSINFKKVVCMSIKVSIAFKFLIFCSQSFRKNSDSKGLSFR